MYVKNPATHVASRSGSVSSSVDLSYEMQGAVREAAEPWAPGEGVESGIRRSARRLRFSYRRTRTLWYRQPCRLLFEEVARVRAWRASRLERRMTELSAELAQLQALEARLRGEPRP